MKEKVKEWISSITKEKSIEEEIEDSKLKKKDKIYFILAIILLICTNVFRLYDGTLSNDAKYMNSVLQSDFEDFDSASVLDSAYPSSDGIELLLNSAYTSSTSSKVLLSYASLVNQVAIAVANIANGNEYEPIVMPEYNGNNKCIKQLLNITNEFNENLEQIQQFREIKDKRELTETETQMLKDSFESVTERLEFYIRHNSTHILVEYSIRIVDVWSFLTFVYVICKFFAHRYYCKKLKKEQKS